MEIPKNLLQKVLGPPEHVPPFLLLCLQEINAALDLLEAGGIQALRLDDHADVVLHGVLAYLQNGCLALAQGLTRAALEAVLQMDDLDAAGETLQSLHRVDARVEGPEGVDLEVEGASLLDRQSVV